MIKILTALVLIFNINFASAGLYDWEYLEPTAGCLIAGGVAYSSASEGNEMKDGAIGCLAAGLIMLGINSHYNAKYGDQYLEEQDYLKSKIKKYNMLEQQSKKKASSNKYFRRIQEVIPPTIDQKGQGVGPRVKEKLILNDDATVGIGD